MRVTDEDSGSRLLLLHGQPLGRHVPREEAGEVEALGLLLRHVGGLGGSTGEDREGGVSGVSGMHEWHESYITL